MSITDSLADRQARGDPPERSAIGTPWMARTGRSMSPGAWRAVIGGGRARMPVPSRSGMGPECTVCSDGGLRSGPSATGQPAVGDPHRRPTFSWHGAVIGDGRARIRVPSRSGRGPECTVCSGGGLRSGPSATGQPAVGGPHRAVDSCGHGAKIGDAARGAGAVEVGMRRPESPIRGPWTRRECGRGHPFPHCVLPGGAAFWQAIVRVVCRRLSWLSFWR